MIFSVIAAKDGDVYHDQVEAADQDEAEKLAREQLADAWHMTDTLQRYRDEGDEDGFDAELDGFAVDPVQTPSATSAERQLIEQIARMTLTTETECGQCEGSGRTQSMSNLEEEECPVCNGSGQVEGDEEGASETLDELIERARAIASGAPCNTPAAEFTEAVPDPLIALEPTA